jgi:hypothetical protein
VQADGSRRRLGSYREASWSPHGLFVAATRRNELAALDPKGRVRWALSRPSVRFPRWTGTRSDTRIAYLTRSRLHVVAGDGTGDRDIAGAAAVAPAWRPGTRTLAYATPTGSVLVYDVDQEEIAWRTKAGEIPTKLEWSSDGGRLIVLRPHALRVYDRGGRAVGRDDPSEGWPDVDASFRPGSSEVAVVRQHGSQSDVFLLANGRLLFSGTGIFERLAWSPNGRWALVGWPTVNQWVFVRRAGGRRIVAVSQIGREFRGFPHVEGWCCR